MILPMFPFGTLVTFKLFVPLKNLALFTDDSPRTKLKRTSGTSLNKRELYEMVPNRNDQRRTKY